MEESSRHIFANVANSVSDNMINFSRFQTTIFQGTPATADARFPVTNEATSPKSAHKHQWKNLLGQTYSILATSFENQTRDSAAMLTMVLLTVYFWLANSFFNPVLTLNLLITFPN